MQRRAYTMAVLHRQYRMPPSRAALGKQPRTARRVRTAKKARRMVSFRSFDRAGSPIRADEMGRILAHWVLSALCLLLVAHFVPGFFVRGFGTAMIAAVVIGLVNGTLGMFLKIVTLPLTIITFGVFWLLINGLMLKLASLVVPGFTVVGLWPAFYGGFILSLLNLTVRYVLLRRLAE
jgi:putative membrane protein